MIIGLRVRELRIAKKLSQGEIEKRSGIHRCYISRLESGRSAPTLETLRRLGKALGVELYELLYEGEEVPPPVAPVKRNEKGLWGSKSSERAKLEVLRTQLEKMSPRNRRVLMLLATQLVYSSNPRKTKKKREPAD